MFGISKNDQSTMNLIWSSIHIYFNGHISLLILTEITVWLFYIRYESYTVFVFFSLYYLQPSCYQYL